MVSLIDTPGFMVGPEVRRGCPRLMSDLFIAGATLTQPIVAIFLRRAYGLGHGYDRGPSRCRVMRSWPQGEFGPWVWRGCSLGFRQELAEAPDEGPAGFIR
ncbi:MAG: hypothetical protein CM15mP74_00250 [Halieaceae bacterium]|nr:MAG: hypothetical protein CM15mP74_00250 [Halieaceae bacterium]